VLGLGRGRQEQCADRGDPGREPAHDRQAPRAHLREARRRVAHRRGDCACGVGLG
jgi:hypothetical protein